MHRETGSLWLLRSSSFSAARRRKQNLAVEVDPNLRTLLGSEPSCMLHGGQPSWTLLPPAIAAAVGVPAGRRHGPLGGRCAVSPICYAPCLPSAPPSVPRSSRCMHCPSSRPAWTWTAGSRAPWACSDAVGKARPLSWPYVSKTGLSAISAFPCALMALCLSAAFCLHGSASCILP